MSSLKPRAVAALEEAERKVRIELAACYRLIAHFRMSDLIYTHISARVPGVEHHFLINPYGLLFDEITASSLVRIGLDGNPVGAQAHGVNYAGFVIHSAIHAARPEVQCVLHTHTRAGVAVSSLACGLLPLNQFALQFYDRVAYHDYEGIADDLAERRRLVADLADKCVMVLRNHGLLTAGRSVAEAFMLMYYLERSCEVQVAAQATGEKLVLPPPEVCRHTALQHSAGEQGMGPPDWPELAWSALVRMLDRMDPGYRD